MMMNNEIKEILDKLKDDSWYEELDLTGTMWIELTWKETHLLLDYITNLQNGFKSTVEELCEITEELERLKKINN